MTNDEFEEDAALFYKDTRFLAPGKSESPAAVGQNDYERNEVRSLMKMAWDKGRTRGGAAKEADLAALRGELAEALKNYETVHGGPAYALGELQKAQARIKELEAVQNSPERVAKLEAVIEARVAQVTLAHEALQDDFVAVVNQKLSVEQALANLKGRFNAVEISRQKAEAALAERTREGVEAVVFGEGEKSRADALEKRVKELEARNAP